MPVDFVVKAARLIDGTGRDPAIDEWVHVRNGTISAVGAQGQPPPSGLPIIDLAGITLLPGFVDAHMHFFGVPSNRHEVLITEDVAYRALRASAEARKMLEAGITTARCLGSTLGPSLRRAINEGHVPGPQLVVSGQFICSTGGTWDYLNLPLELVARTDMIADGPEGLRAIVRRRVRQGATVVKIGLSKGRVVDDYHAWGDDPFDQAVAYSIDEVRAAVDEAHTNGLKVSAHCVGEQAVRLALDGGVDVIEHGYAIEAGTRDRIAERGIIVVSTMSQLYFHLRAEEEYRYQEWERRVYRRHIEAMYADFESGVSGGVRYALGSDLIGYPTHPQDLAPKEFELAAQHGMTPMQAIVAGTSISAEALGLGDTIGTVEAGKTADMVGVVDDPIENIATLQHVAFVMHRGEVVVDRINGPDGSDANAAQV